jgi:putative endonuclease
MIYQHSYACFHKAVYRSKHKNYDIIMNMKKTTKQIGDFGEDRATEYLESLGYEIFERNFRTRFGEIDIIARDGETLCFIEVKAKASDRFGSPAEMITPKKLDRIIRTAKHYVQENDLSVPWRIDAVLIQGDKIELIRNIT